MLNTSDIENKEMEYFAQSIHLRWSLERGFWSHQLEILFFCVPEE